TFTATAAHLPVPAHNHEFIKEASFTGWIDAGKGQAHLVNDSSDPVQTIYDSGKKDWADGLALHQVFVVTKDDHYSVTALPDKDYKWLETPTAHYTPRKIMGAFEEVVS